MTQPADQTLLQAVAALHEALHSIGAPAMIIGGIAVILRGIPRLTQDIDAIIWAQGLDMDAVIQKLASHNIVPRIDDAAQFATDHHVLLLKHGPTDTPMELMFAWLPFELEAIERATEESFGGVRINVAQPEDLVVLKTVAWRDRDRSDVERLLLLHGGAMDLDRIRRLIAAFAEALEEPERIAEFENIVARTKATLE